MPRKIEFDTPDGGKYIKVVPDNVSDEELDQIATRVQTEGVGVFERLGDLWKRGREAVLESAGAQPYGVGPAARGVGEIVIPETLGQAAGEAALALTPLGPLGKAATVGGRLAAGALRGAAGAAATGGMSAITGDPDRALSDAAMTGAGAMAGTAGGEVVRAVRQNIATRAQKAADTASIVGSVRGVSPGQGVKEVAESFFNGKAVRRAGQHMQQAEDAINALMPEARQTFDQLKAIRFGARAEGRAGDPQVFQTRAMEDAVEENLFRNLRAVAPQQAPALEAAYRASIADMTKTRAAAEFLGERKLWLGEADQVTPDMTALRDRALDTDKRSGKKWLQRLQESGNQDIIDAIRGNDSIMLRDEATRLAVGGGIASVGPVNARTPFQGIPVGTLRVPSVGRQAVPRPDPRVNALLGGILTRMGGQGLGLGNQ